MAKKNHAGKLKKQLSSNDPTSVWKGLKAITSYKTPPPSTEANQQLTEDLNSFYCRFQKQKPGLTPHTHSDHPTTQPSTPSPSLPPTVSQPVIKICEEDVSKVFRRQKIRKAKGPDGVSPACLKACAVQLSSIFTLIFNRSLELCEVPSCFKRSTIIPVPKKPKITGLNDYRPVALTSVVMKSFERLVLAHLKDITGPLLDPLQFAYRANRSVDDAVNMGLHYILQHLDKPGTYARILFVDFSSAFNTIIPDTLQNKLTQLSVPTSICQWITSFLTDRQQLVRLGKFSSNTCTISTGAPQGCVLSPLLFSLYTNDCTSKDPSVKLLKFADDTTLIGLIQDGDKSAYRQEVKELAVWCSLNNLELNTLKTVEMIVDFRRNPPALPPLTIMNNLCECSGVIQVPGNHHLSGPEVGHSHRLHREKGPAEIVLSSSTEKVQPATGAHDTVLLCCYWVGSVLFYNCMVGSASKSDIRDWQRTVRTAERIIGVHLPSLQDLYYSRVKKRAGNIITDPSHPGHDLFALLPSGRRYRSLCTRTSRHKNSFFPYAISSLNN